LANCMLYQWHNGMLRSFRSMFFQIMPRNADQND
jgi:hypothetical protein